MPTKLRGAVKDDFLGAHNAHAHPGFSVVRGRDFHLVWISGASSAKGSRAVHLVDIFFVSFGGDWDWLGDVPVFALMKNKRRD
jgi:hypothetical protein